MTQDPWDELSKRRVELQDKLTDGHFDYEEWMTLAAEMAEFDRPSAAEGVRRRAEHYKLVFQPSDGMVTVEGNIVDEVLDILESPPDEYNFDGIDHILKGVSGCRIDFSLESGVEDEAGDEDDDSETELQ